MSRILLLFYLLITTFATAQSNANALLRQQTFGVYASIEDLQSYQPDSNSLVVFGNGYILSKEEFESVYHSSGADSQLIPRKKYLDQLIVSYRKCFEAMKQDMDTSVRFQIDFLKHKQELITPYLNEGKTRAEAEALPEVKFEVRRYYAEKMGRMLMNHEVWTKSSVEADQRTFFFSHPELYQGQPFEISKTKVVFDLQKELEAGLATKLEINFPCKLNQALITKL